MSKDPILPARVPLTQPGVANTNKDQKSFRAPEEYDARAINAELDKLHDRVNKIVVEDEALEDLPEDGTATNAEICIQLNKILETIRRSGLRLRE